eukprot:TRINITY_DN1488_c0_g1_i1.p1 TRINITY_DN1488_c0_g1~~TRINITY_DN1488_c0_g1_i1.p1  ORF type:complete len:977 (+),score=147.61 TRINITY_DN1488_c0_g1_i1:215-2932(+)
MAFCVTPDITDFYAQSSLIASLLPEEKPSELEWLWPRFCDEVDYCRRDFVLDFLPAGLFARLMVRMMSRKPKKMPQMIWRNGFFISKKSSKIMLELIPTQRKIQLSARGKVTSSLFTLMVESISALSQWYNVNVKTELPCVHCHQKKIWDSYVFRLEECEAAIDRGLSVVHCQGVIPVRLDKLAPDLMMTSLTNKKIEYGDIHFVEKIDEGGFAKVYKANYSDMIVAVKELKEKNTADMTDFRKETWMMSGLNHANLISLVGFCLNPPCIVSEYITHGNLYELVYDKSKPLVLEYILRVAMDIAKGLRFLHVKLSPSIIHNDLKSPNVLLVTLDENAEVVAKITDFGLSHRALFQGNQNKEIEKINPRWAAPEVLQGLDFTSKVDIYSFGVMLWEMVTRDFYMEEKWMFLISEKIIKGVRPEIPQACPKALRDLIVACWAPKPENRPDINGCVDQLFAAISELCPYLLTVATAERPVLNTNIRENTKPASETSVTCAPQLKSFEDIKNENLGQIQCMQHVPHLNQVWIGDSNGNLVSFSERGEFISMFECHDKGITSFLMTKDYIWTSSFDGSIRVWNLDNFHLEKEIKPINVGAMIKVSGSIWVGTYELEVWIVKKKNYKVGKKFNMSQSGIAVSTITSMLYKKPYVWIGTNSVIFRVDYKTEKVVDILVAHTKYIHKMIDVGNEVWSCSSDTKICVWDQKTGQCKQVLGGHSGRVFDLVVEKSQNPTVWSSSWDSSIFIWDAKTKQLKYEGVSTHSDAVSCIVQVGGLMWSGSWDRKICKWQTTGLRDLVHSAMSTDFASFVNTLQIPMCYDNMHKTLPTSISSVPSPSSSTVINTPPPTKAALSLKLPTKSSSPDSSSPRPTSSPQFIKTTSSPPQQQPNMSPRPVSGPVWARVVPSSHATN